MFIFTEMLRDDSFSTYAKFSEKLTFLTPDIVCKGDYTPPFLD